MVKKATNTTRPYWASKKNAQTAPITFTRKFGEANKIHSLSELHQLEHQLIQAFRLICLAGDFTLVFIAQEKGGPDSKGLTLFGVSKNSVLVAFQPGSNDTRFSYGIPLPSADIAIDVHKRLDEILKQASVERESKRPALALVPKPELIEVNSEPAASVVETEFRVAEVQTGDQLMLVAFDASLDVHTPFEALKEHLLAILSQHGSEGIFTVKKGESTNDYTSNAVGLKFCQLQPGASGIGFWFRESPVASWHKYALVTEASFDLETFASEVAPQSAGHHVPEVKGVLHGHLKPTSFIEDFANNANAQEAILNQMAKFMQANGVQEVFSRDQVRLFTEVMRGDYNPVSIGKLMSHWVDQGLLRRKRPSPSSTSWNYAFGFEAAKLLAEPFKGLAPRRIASAHEVKELATAEVTVATVTVASSNNPVADALELIAAQEQAIADAKAKLLQFVELSEKVKTYDDQLAMIGEQIKTLIRQGEDIKHQRDEFAKQLPSQTEISLTMASIRK